MPGGDQTGPRGEGARTGWGLGLCEGNDQPGTASPRPYGRKGRNAAGRGFRGGGRNYADRNWGGRGRRNQRFDSSWDGSENFTPTSNSKTQEIETIKAQNQALQTTLQKILKRLNKLKA